MAGFEDSSTPLNKGANWAPLKQSISLTSLVVRDYDEAIDFYVGTLGFSLVEDTYIKEQDKRWVVVAPPGSAEFESHSEFCSSLSSA
jgi:hypothetical protein